MVFLGPHHGFARYVPAPYPYEILHLNRPGPRPAALAADDLRHRGRRDDGAPRRELRGRGLVRRKDVDRAERQRRHLDLKQLDRQLELDHELILHG